MGHHQETKNHIKGFPEEEKRGKGQGCLLK
jgi:hypothetical protein